MSPSRLASLENYKELLDKYDTWMFDCDGVLWSGDTLIEGATDVLQLLRSHGKSVLFVTNNATKSRKTYKKKFDDLGVQAHVDEIFSSAYATAIYISSVMKLPKDKKVYVIGQDGLEAELDEEGITHLGGSDPADCKPGPFSLSNFTRDPSVAAVVCGLDMSVTYTKLSKAFQYLLLNENCEFIATNEDSTYPSSGGLLPGAGAVFAPLVTALKREPLAIGKPKKTMIDCIKAKHDFDPARTLMIGDRLNTDIAFGQSGGLSTLLVLTGITSEAEVYGPHPDPVVPDYVTNSLGDLRALI